MMTNTPDFRLNRLQIGHNNLKFLLLGLIFLIGLIAIADGVIKHAAINQLIYHQVATISKQTTIPFQYHHKNIIIQATINGQGPFNFLLDSGVYPSVITPKTAKKIGLKIGLPTGKVLGFGHQNLSYSNTTLANLKVGNITLKGIEGIIAEQVHLQQVGVSLAGVLGHSFLEQFITRIDYGQQTIQLSQILPKDFLQGQINGKDYIQFPLVLSGGKIPIIQDITINNKRITTWLDTGFAAELALTKATARRAGLHHIIESGKSAMATGTRGNFGLKYGKIDKLRIASFEKDTVQTFVFDQGGHNMLGNAFFEDYILTLDYINEQVYLEKYR